MAIRMQLAPRVICTRCQWLLYIYEKDGQLLANHGAHLDCPDAGKDFLMPTMDLAEATPQPRPPSSLRTQPWLVDPAT